MLEADAPLPSRLARGRPRVWVKRLGPRAGNGHRAVARQPPAPILITGLQRLLDQQSAEARAIDEEVRLDDLPAFERDRRDVAIFGGRDVDDAPFGPPDAMHLGKRVQIFRIERGIEVKRIGDVADRRFRHFGPCMHELVGKRRGGVDRIVPEVPGPAALVRAQPILMTAQPLPILADNPEAVNETMTVPDPVDKLDPELERRLAPLHELDFVELDQLVVFLDRRDGRFTNADRADRLALDELDFVETLKQLAEQGRRHPPGSSPTNDQDFLHRRAD